MPTSKKVLIAEDSSVIQNLAKKILEFQNFEITAVKNGEQVIQLLDKEDFDIVLLDINMPVMDGMECQKSKNASRCHHRKCKKLLNRRFQRSRFRRCSNETTQF
jgi:CheY-like chemotaxis protein